MTAASLSAALARLVGLGLLGLLAAAAFAGPDLLGTDPGRQSLMRTLALPGGANPLGTDYLGRDMAARLLAGARLSLLLAVLSVLTAAVPGTLLGVLAGWAGGWPVAGSTGSPALWPTRCWPCQGCSSS